MRHDPRQLGSDDAQYFAPLGDLDSEQPLRAKRERDIVADRVEVVFAVGPADYLIVLPVFSDLLEAAVQIPNVRDAPHDGLAIELEYKAKNSVSRGMLRTDVDEHVLTFEIRLDAGWRLDGDGGSTIVGHERNPLRSSLRIEARCRELYFDCALRHLLPGPFAFVQPLTHVLWKLRERVGNRQLLH